MAKVPVKNLKGTIPNFPKVPDVSIPQYDSSVVGNSPSFDDMFNNLLSSTPSSNKIENIPLSSFYIGNRYPESRPNTNVEEMAALQQSGWGQLGNGILKMAGKAGTSFVSGTAGLIYGIGKSITNGKFSDLYNNEITQTMDNVDKYLHDALPNYYTEAENSAEWWHKNNLLTANFVGDKILNNLGFSIGSLAGGVAWSSVFKGIGLTNNLVKAGKGLEALEATEKAMRAVPKAQKHIAFMNALQKTAQTYVKTPISSVLKSSDRIITSAMGTFGEASLEALQNTNEFRNKLIDNFREKNGRYPQEAELAEINEYADKVGNFTWGFNTLLLTGTNYVMLPKILGSSRKADKALSNITKVSPTGKFQAIKPSYISKGISGISKVFIPQEAFEEGAQFATQIGVNQYFERAYNNKQDIDSFYNNLSGAFKGVINEGIHETLNSKEGIESMLIGALSGGLQQGVGSLVSRIKNGRQPSEQQRTEAAVEILNSSNLKKYLQDFADYTARGLNSQNLRQQAIEQDDIVGEKDYEMDYTLSYVIPRVKYGKLDSVTQEIDYYLQQSLTQEGFQELKNEGIINPNETREQFVERVENLKNIARKVDSLYTQINDRYSPFVNEKGEKVYSDKVIDKMVYAASKIEDYNNRIVDLSTPLVEAGLTPDIILNDLNKGEFTSLEQAEQEINNSQTLSPEQQDDVKSQLVDLIRVSQARTKLINEYNELRVNPSSYAEIPVSEEQKGKVISTDENKDKDSLIISTNKGETEIVVGEEYFLGKIVEYDKSGKEVYRAPRLTILQENEDGTIKIKDSNGNVRDVNKSVFADYNLSKVSSVKDNKKANFFMENWNTIFEFNFGKNKKKRGRLEYSPKEGVLLFKYKDGNKIKTIEVTGDQFIPKKGFTKALINPVGQLTSAQQKAQDEFTSQNDERLQKKREGRINILTDLFNKITENNNSIVSLIAEKQKQVLKITEELSQIEKQIDNSEFDGRSKNSLRFKSKSKQALETAIELSRTKNQLEEEIKNLESQKEELEFNASYVADLTQNLDELPSETDEFLEELKSQRNIINDAIVDTGILINDLTSLIDKVKSALDSAINYLKDLINQFQKKYPKVPLAEGQELIDFLQANPNFLKKKPDYLSELKELEGLLSQVEDLDIVPNERTLNELNSELNQLQEKLVELEKEYKAKDSIINYYEKLVNEAIKNKEASEKLLKNKELQRAILGTKDTGVENAPNDPNYEPVAKKDSNTIVNSTKVPSDSILPHHIRSNFFGINFSLFPNRDKIRGVIVTSKNEAELGLSGLMDYLKGDSEVDPLKTIALVFVEESENGTITLLNKEGKPLTVPSIQEAIYQVFPDPELTWSQKWGGGSMFRKGTTSDEINYYKEEYKKWVNETLNNPSLTTYNVVPSMGKPVIEEENGEKQYNTRNSVIDANLIKSENLQNNPLIYVPTLSKAEEKNGVQFTLIPGRPYLNLPNGFVPLNNRQFTQKEAATLYKVILELSKDIAKNEDAQSPKSKKLINWLKSVIYWGTPKNNAGYNSIFFDTKDDKFNLYISGKNFSLPFTPQSIENSKDKLITIFEGMYNNVQGGLTDKAEIWNAPYEQITDITPEGEIITKKWDNYQTYLLTSPNLPLSTNIAKYTENKPNRGGIYFTVPNLSEKYFYVSPKKEEIVITKETPKTEIKEEKPFVISDLTLNFVPNSDLVKTKGARKNKAEQKRIKDELEQLNNILKCLSAI